MSYSNNYFPPQKKSRGQEKSGRVVCWLQQKWSQETLVLFWAFLGTQRRRGTRALPSYGSSQDPVPTGGSYFLQIQRGPGPSLYETPAQCQPSTDWLNGPSKLVRQGFWLLCYSWGSRGWERLSGLPQVAQLGSGSQHQSPVLVLRPELFHCKARPATRNRASFADVLNLLSTCYVPSSVLVV